MKTKTKIHTMIGNVQLELKCASFEIEWKYFIEGDQLCLKHLSTIWKTSDKKNRKIHEVDYMKDFSRKSMIKKIGKKINKNLTNSKIIWWEQK